MADTTSTDTSEIQNWRSIVTLLLFVLTNIIVLFPFHVPIYLPRFISDAVLRWLRSARVIPAEPVGEVIGHQEFGPDGEGRLVQAKPYYVRLAFPLNFVTAPILADLFLLAILAIGREEVYDGTVGADHISPIDIMVFFLTLAYIAISIDASGLIRYLAFRVLKWGEGVGHRLFFLLYCFFFGLGTFIGNDPIILSGTAFLAYMTRVSSNIMHPRAWIHTQFAVANIASAILVSSNPTNLVLAGAFQIKFINYTANMIVPVVATAIVLFPFLLYIVFASEAFIPQKIKRHELPESARGKPAVNPNIPNARGTAAEDEEDFSNEKQVKLLSLEEIMNPFLDKGGAAFGGVIMTAALVTLLAINAASQTGDENPVFWVTLPAAFVMFCWDVGFGWYRREETRRIAQNGRREILRARAERIVAEEDRLKLEESGLSMAGALSDGESPICAQDNMQHAMGLKDGRTLAEGDAHDREKSRDEPEFAGPGSNTSKTRAVASSEETGEVVNGNGEPDLTDEDTGTDAREVDPERQAELEERISRRMAELERRGPATLVSLCEDAYRWCQVTFPTVTAVLAHLPFPLVPFALAMFVLVQALVTKGWVPVFAYGWYYWVNKTGTLGAIVGMGFLSTLLCNFAGTNIGTTILLSRVIQAWIKIHEENQTLLTDRAFWGTVYSMALGVNYGAFSTAFSASLAGLLWRDILARKHINVGRLEFARVNLPIIAIAMTVGCAVLVGEIYIIRTELPAGVTAP